MARLVAAVRMCQCFKKGMGWGNPEVSLCVEIQLRPARSRQHGAWVDWLDVWVAPHTPLSLDQHIVMLSRPSWLSSVGAGCQ